MYTITKKFGSYPFAHRQHNHEGHCALVHGHNWFFEITLTSKTLDENGFVYDFGKFKELKKWFDYTFDHTLLINADDPELPFFESNKKYWALRVVECGSAERLAEYVFKHVETYLQGSGATILSCTAYEDEKNSATYHINYTEL